MEEHTMRMRKIVQKNTLRDYADKFLAYKKASKVSQRTLKDYQKYINDFIDLARQSGYLVAYNHPNWSMESDENILSYEAIFSLEIFNTQSMIENQNEYNLALYDKLLRKGKFMYCHGADDNHNKVPLDSIQNDSFQ